MSAEFSPNLVSPTGELAPKSSVTTRPAAVTWKQVLPLPPEPNASPQPTTFSFVNQAFALGRSDTTSRQRRRWVWVAGTSVRITRMKSTATSAVMSATVKRFPAT